MDEFKKQQFNQLGISTFTELSLDGRTRDYLQLPNGKTLAYFDYLFQILPGDLYDGEECALGWGALPDEVSSTGVQTVEHESETGLELEDGSLWAPIGWIAVLLVLSFVIYVYFTMRYTMVEKQNAPCGITGQQRTIDECWKLIIRPDCYAAEFNSCADPDGDGIPEGEIGPWEKDINDPWEQYLKWIVIGAVAIGGVVIISLLLKSRGQAQYAQQFPGYGPPPPSLGQSISSRLYKPRKPSKAPPEVQKISPEDKEMDEWVQTFYQ